MDSTERLVQAWIISSPDSDKEISEIVSDISENKISLLNVVKALGEYLTSEDSEILSKGVALLSSVVARVPQETLNRQSVRVLTSFFTGKLDDSATVKHALNGLLTFSSLPTFSPSEANIVLEEMFRHVKMKGLVQDIRFKVFSIIDTLMAKQREALKLMGKGFLDGYIYLAEGEKDPRNLLVAFAIARVILIEFDISAHVETMFNILFCYFPITFRPPPNDKYGISADDLKAGLRQCLSGTPAFGTLAVPVFLEKLLAGSRATKRDVLHTLRTCLPIYGPAVARAFSRKLWNSLKLEVFQPVDSQAEHEALETIQALVNTIYTENNPSTGDEDIQGLAREASEECIQILKEPEKSQARPATKILCAFMSTTPSVARYTISQVIPHFVQLFHNPDELPTRFATLSLLSEVIDAARAKGPSAEHVLLPFKDAVLGLYTVGLQSPQQQPVALSGLKAMVSSEGLLTDEELGFIVHNVNDIIERDQDDTECTSEAILELLTTIGERIPRYIIDQTLPLLFASLPDIPPSRDAAADREKCWKLLFTLQKLCVQQAVFEVMVVRLMTKFDLLCFPSKPGGDDVEPAQAYAHMILKTLAMTLDAKVKANHPDVAKYIDSLVPRLFNVFVASVFMSADRKVIASEPRLFRVAAEIITFVVQTLPVSKQQAHCPGLSKAIVDGVFKDIAQGFQNIPSGEQFSIFGPSSRSTHRDLLALLSSAVVPWHREIRLQVDDIGQFLKTLFRWSLDTADTELQRTSALHLGASIINRTANGELAEFLNNSLETYWPTEIMNASLPAQRRKWAIEIWTWVSKALLVRKHQLAMKFVERLYEAFQDENIGWDAAKALGNIIDPDTVLTKANHADVKVLYVQKYVNTVLPNLISSAKGSSGPARQTASLVALTAVIKASPRATFAHELPTLTPFLLRGLDLKDPDIRANVIDTFIAAAEGETPEKSIVSEHSSELVKMMLKNSKVEDMPVARVRISALKYLALLPGIVRYDILHPCKPIVLKELATVLDDPKRSVRQEAVDARTKWFKYKG